MIKDILNESRSRMMKSIETFKTELSKLRTGRAHPGLLDHVRVSYYDVETPLSQVAAISVENPRTLAVVPWEKNMVAAIEKAIRASDLGLNPMSAGMTIRVPLPPLTEERRKELVRVVREEAEKVRISIRNIRREANQGMKELLKAKEISEDEERKSETNIQKLTDEYIADIDKITQEKEADLMTM
jgi:ribosome recycling factor